jgi:hypothetical protein
MNSLLSIAQQFDVEQTIRDIKGKDIFKLSGGASASLTSYLGSGNGNERLPLVYNFNGNLNLSILKSVSIPVSYNFSNSGGQYSYPTLANRLSIHPRYRNTTLHIGDFSLMYSPYTMNGHQIKGLGIETMLYKKVKFSSFYGELRKSMNYDSSNKTLLACYQRVAYGGMINYDTKKTSLSTSFLVGNDFQHSIHELSDSLRLYPQHNFVWSLKFLQRFQSNFSLEAEYGLSILTEDIRDKNDTHHYWSTFGLIKQNNSTSDKSAYRFRLSYMLMKNNIGISYERIAPGYQSMGSYYMNNDLESFSIDYNRPVFKQKVVVNLKGGIQRDNLDKLKNNSSQRLVGSLNLLFNISNCLKYQFALNTFRSYFKVKNNSYDNTIQNSSDTLNFLLSNYNLSNSMMYSLVKSKSFNQNIVYNFTFQNSDNKQGDKTLNASQVKIYTHSLTYLFNHLVAKYSASFTFFSTSTFMTSNSTILGPSISFSKKIINDKCTVVWSTSYNKNVKSSGGNNIDIVNSRIIFSFSYKVKHNYSLSFLSQFKPHIFEKSNDNTIVVLYSFNF